MQLTLHRLTTACLKNTTARWGVACLASAHCNRNTLGRSAVRVRKAHFEPPPPLPACVRGSRARNSIDLCAQRRCSNQRNAIPPNCCFCRDQTNTLKLNLQSIHSSIFVGVYIWICVSDYLNKTQDSRSFGAKPPCQDLMKIS